MPRRDLDSSDSSDEPPDLDDVVPLAEEPEDIPEDAKLFIEPASRIPVPAPDADDAVSEESEECKAAEENQEAVEVDKDLEKITNIKDEEPVPIEPTAVKVE